ncbi:hypothetical protein [Ammoniphilus sp. YIM 78166]|uniref:hypothetical protein n=1 Tax=Ammoniphilus sp. YIM 78166 TaxID=1644106 RepID=UPI00106FB593|nr:hypothetical protein [Ammoniphilus sp. YIM 78166]
MARIVYSSGVIENDKGFDPFQVRPPRLQPIARAVFVNVFNNNREPVTVRVRIFSLNTFRRRRGAFTDYTLDGHTLNVDTLPSANFFRYEVQVIVEARTLAKAKNVIIAMFPKSPRGNVLASQRLVHSEFKIISRKS